MLRTPARSRALARGLASLLFATVFACSLPAAAADNSREVRRTLAVTPGVVLELENLAGKIDVRPSTGAEIEIVATVRAAAKNEAEAQALAALLDLTLERDGERAVASLSYPIDKHSKYVYPDDDWGWGSRTTTRFRGERVTVYGAPHGGAVTLYADLAVRLPRGVGAKLRNAVGQVVARDIEGDLRLSTGSGDVEVNAGRGDTVAETGSGDVQIADRAGKARAETGSGDVRCERLAGEVAVETGSGDVVATDLTGGPATFSTGSGDVRLTRVANLADVETGSGTIVGVEIAAGDHLTASTGSGDVRLSGDFAAARRLLVETGSGDVLLGVGSSLDAQIDVSTGSGGIDVNLARLSQVRSKRGSFQAQIGEGSGGRVTISTGSGDVRVGELLSSSR